MSSKPALIPPQVKNLVFDLGGVILNINHSLTAAAFKQLGVPDFEKRISFVVQEPVFDELEVGAIEAAVFRAKLQREFGLALSDAHFDSAWNAMLLDIPAHRIALLRRLRGPYRIFLLSNTNCIHIDRLCAYLQESFSIASLDQLFDKCYLSYRVGLRKPHAEIYRHVLKDGGLTASETIFLDDSLPNVEAARGVGMHALHIKPGSDITSYFGD